MAFSLFAKYKLCPKHYLNVNYYRVMPFKDVLVCLFLKNNFITI